MIKKLKLKIFIIVALLLIVPFNMLIGVANVGAQRTVDFFHRQSIEGLTSDDLEFMRPHGKDFYEEISLNIEPLFEIDLSSETYEVISLSGDPVPEDINVIIEKAKMDLELSINRPIGIDGSVSGHYIYTYDENNQTLILRDISNTVEQEALGIFHDVSLLLLLFGSCVLFILALVITNIVTKPVEQAFKRQRQFINDASHELKTPLSIIALNLELIKEQNNNKQEYHYINNEVKRMDKLIKNLLNSSKAEELNKKLKLKPENISNALYEVALPFESIAYEKGVTIDFNIEEEIIHNVDIESLKQVFVILIDNAIKFTPTNNRIEVTLTKNRKLNFQVFNSGSFIKKENRKVLFERFYRGDESRTNNGSYGLGLSIAKDIVEKHKGKINVDSNQDGTTFTVKL